MNDADTWKCADFGMRVHVACILSSIYGHHMAWHLEDGYVMRSRTECENASGVVCMVRGHLSFCNTYV